MMVRLPQFLSGSGGFDPRRIAGLKLGLDARKASSVVLASGGVSEWRDISGQGNHASQATEGDRPSYNQGVSVAIGSGKSLILPAAIRAIYGGAAWTQIDIFDLDDETATQSVGGPYSNTYGNIGSLYFSSTLLWNYYNGAGVQSASGGAATTGLKIIGTIVSGANLVMRRAGAQVATRTDYVAVTCDSARVGAYGANTNHLLGRVRAKYLWDRALTSSELATADRGLARAFKIPL